MIPFAIYFLLAVFSPICHGYLENRTLLAYQPIENWGKEVYFGAQYFRQPTTEEEIVQIVNEVRERGGHIRMVGSAHSHTEVALTSDTMVNLDKYNLYLGRKDSLVTFQAGARIFQINDKLDTLGLALENLGWSAEFAFAGTMQIGTHGTNRRFGALATQVAEFRMVLANGTVITASSSENSDIFNCRLNLGTLGIVSTITLRTVPAFRLYSFHNSTDYPTLLEQLRTLPYTTEQTAFVEWYWTHVLPDSSTGQYITYWRPFTTDNVTGCDKVDGYDGPEGCVDVSHKVFNEEDPFKYWEIEMFIPEENSVDALQEFNGWQEEFAKAWNKTDPVTITRMKNTFTGVRYIRGDDIWLSPAYGRATAVISHFQYISSPNDWAFFSIHLRKLQEITRKYKGRPHWGKLHFLTAAELAPLYPKWNDFLSLREKLDPTNLFLSPYARDLFYPNLPPNSPSQKCDHGDLTQININFNGLLPNLP